MITLSINTSTKITHLALHNEKEILSSFCADLGREQSNLLQEKISALLAEANLSKEDIELIAVTNGPGFYTGIRCGLTFALGLAYALKLPVVPLSSLDLLQEAALMQEKFSDKRFIIPYIKSKSNSVFAQIFDRTENKLIENPACHTLDCLLDFVKQNKNTIFVSYDTALYEDLAQLSISLENDITKCFINLLAKQTAKPQSPLDVKAIYYREPDIG
ncbi:MAG: tRNA (adenosine(37)-N6)-threonylcarbamoyltransferase complex dimerization subunit type 1 TsaB [Synergistaceae bacterium]|nr:tRNA (adenosine(37)-N6)-threonylcarbamoyltransferase complex dimerization subunit type 1 TsaB [Synergistaceae bacterium]